jgi:hypothetical protein
MAYQFYKRNYDNTFYAFDAETDTFKVVTDPTHAGSANMCAVMYTDIANANIIQTNTQISANPTEYVSITEAEFNNRIFSMKSFLEQNL